VKQSQTHRRANAENNRATARICKDGLLQWRRGNQTGGAELDWTCRQAGCPPPLPGSPQVEHLQHHLALLQPAHYPFLSPAGGSPGKCNCRSGQRRLLKPLAHYPFHGAPTQQATARCTTLPPRAYPSPCRADARCLIVTTTLHPPGGASHP
jgi:hypothetical protein